MTTRPSPYRFLLINPFSLAPGSSFQMRTTDGPKEAQLYNHADVAPALEGVDWDLHAGARATHGNWPVETKQEFLSVGANRLPLVREACASGRYNAIVLLGGGDPGYMEAREIGRQYRTPITSCAHAQMHVAGLLGHKFSVIDISETHNMQMAHLVVQYRMTDRCASIRNVNFPLPKPHLPDERPIQAERDRALAGEPSAMLDAAVTESIAAIEDDGADVLMLGCSAAYWLRPLLEKRLHAIGWDVPVLEGYRCAITVAKTLVDLGVDASGLAFPGERPAKWRRKKVF
ncbi:MAG TPA: aspartate/glutamate racemase family protein [Vineibacter sp.]|nr:aspartate/glutamate racemase family protein [Vineibacter sp.]